MKRNAFLLQVIVFIGFSLIINGCGDRKIIAKVGNRLVRLSDFKNKVMSDQPRDQVNKIAFDKQIGQLNTLIEDELKLLDAFTMGLDKDSLILSELKAFEREMVFRYAIDKEVIDKVIKSGMLRKKYEMKGKEIKLKQIFIPFDSKAESGAEKDARNQMESLRRRILAGEKFDVLAREFSKDSLSAGKGGELGFIKLSDPNYGKLIFEAAYDLRPGQLSSIIESTKGYHLVWVEKKRALEQAPFESQENTLKRSFYREKNTELNATYGHLLEKIKKMYPIHYEDRNLLHLLELSRPDTTAPVRRRYFKITGELTEEDKQKVVAEYNGQKMTIDDFIREIEKSSPMRRPYFDELEQMKKYLDNRISKQLIIQWGYKKGFQKPIPQQQFGG